MELLLVPIIFFVDQWTKTKALEQYSDKNGKLVGDLINLKVVYNKGAFMGLLKKNRFILLVSSIVGVALVLIMSVYVFVDKGSHYLKIGMALILGGGLGNMYDRLKRKKVVDFFAFKRGKVYFNLADMFVFVGMVVIIIGSLIKQD